MSARAEIQVATHADALAVPIQAVVERKPKATGDAPADKRAAPVSVVFVVENGKAKSLPVKSGISDSTEVEIVEGLAGGEQVITGPYRALRKLEDGDAVQVTTPELEARDRKSSDDKASDDSDGDKKSN